MFAPGLVSAQFSMSESVAPRALVSRFSQDAATETSENLLRDFSVSSVLSVAY